MPPNLTATSQTRLTPNTIQFAAFDYDFLPCSNPSDNQKKCDFGGSFNRITVYTVNTAIFSTHGALDFSVPPPLFLNASLLFYDASNQPSLEIPIAPENYGDQISGSQQNFWAQKIGAVRTVTEVANGGGLSQQKIYWGFSLGGSLFQFGAGLYSAGNKPQMVFRFKNFGGGTADNTRLTVVGQTFDINAVGCQFKCLPWWAQNNSQDDFGQANRVWGATLFMLENV